MIYCDTSYLVRLYIEDPGFEEVRELCARDNVACCSHGRAETPAAFHRGFQDGRFTEARFRELIDQFEQECALGAFVWFPAAEPLFESLTRDFRALPQRAFLRASDALHLVCARDHGFREIYSNDKHMLAAAKHFGLNGVNVIA